LLVDHTTGTPVVVSESKEIVRHLWREYGPADGAEEVSVSLARGDARFEKLAPYVPGSRTTRLKNLLNLLCDEDLVGHMAATVLRPRAVMLTPPGSSGGEAEWGGLPEGIQLWGHESCPATRLVREFLCMNQIRYILHSQSLDAGPKVNIPATGPFDIHIHNTMGLEQALRQLAEHLAAGPDAA